MENISWDENKRLKVLAERGIDFVDAAIALIDQPHARFRSNRKDEEYYVGLVKIDGKIWAVIHLWRDESLRIVTVRRARRNEERTYRELHNR